MVDEEIDHRVGKFERFVLWTIWIAVVTLLAFLAVIVTIAAKGRSKIR
jgi:predicted transcriptional regulator